MKTFRTRKDKRRFPVDTTAALNKKLLEENRALLLEQENQLKSIQKLQSQEIAALRKIGAGNTQRVALRLKQRQARSAQKKKHGAARVALRKKAGQERKARKKATGYSHAWSGFTRYERKGPNERWGD